MADINDPSGQVYQTFRPSVYSTGVQTVMPYGTKWVEGDEYGSWYNPLSWGADARDAAVGVATSYLDTVKSVAQSASEAYQAKVAAEQAAREAAEAERMRTLYKKLVLAGGVAAVGIGSLVAYQRYKKLGKVF